MAITKKGRSEKIVSVTAVNPTMVRPLQLRNVREIARRRRARSRMGPPPKTGMAYFR
jgi:hypothetical protein